LNGLLSLSFQVHSFDQASTSIPSLPTQYSHSFPLYLNSIGIQQCWTAGLLESSRLWRCRCSSHLMLLSGVHAGRKGVEDYFCIPVDSISKTPLKSTSLVVLVQAKCAETSQAVLSLPSLPMRLSARNKMPPITLSVSYSPLQKYAHPVDWSIRCEQAV
jgi:hypothetical protein